MKKCQFSWIGSFLHNKRDLRADGLPLQPPALRPRLLSCANYTKDENFQHGKNLLFLTKIFPLVIPSFICLLTLFISNPVSATSVSLSISEPITMNLDPTTGFKESEPMSISVSTQDASFGYNLDIKAQSDNTLKNGDNKLTSILQNYSNTADFQSNAPINSWGYKPSVINNLTNSSYLPGPTSTSVIEKTSSSSPSNKTYTISIAAKADSNLSAGTYKNTFILSVVANTITYRISYNSNNGSSVSSTSGTTGYNIIKLNSTKPTRNNYEFKGWCSVYTTTENCSGGQVYQPGANFTLTGSNSNTTLYAMWKSTGGCFMAGTLIDTPDGLKPIEDIEEGMKVYAYDFTTGEIKEDTIEKTFKLSSNNVVRLTFDDNTTIRATYNHFFYNWEEGGWDQIGDYQYGDIITTVDGADSMVKSLDGIEGIIDVYNLRTKEYFNFIVVTSEYSSKNPATPSSMRYVVLGIGPDEDSNPNYPILPISGGA